MKKTVNYYKSKHKEWVKEITDAHSDYVLDINSQNHKIQLENSKKEKEAKENFNKEIRSKKAEISNMKVLIPNGLQSILDEVLEYAKK